MSDVVIKAEGLGKKYLIGHQSERERYTALRDVLSRNLKSVLNKTRQVLSGQQLLAGDEIEEFWALRDIDFEIKRGDRVGIIGRNGAGKSTLLKVLSRITEPSAGRVEIRGRVASLLEVGTGFHPELTGRENIFLNGAILGMTRAEIKKKFDEIVDFAGVEKFLDTPVKRYSSGMYVRLAFAVAAHLEPEILVVDEVLAVGDAEFQKKCLGKMEDVSKNEGRTVLFVSHNTSAIKQLTSKSIYLKQGVIEEFGDTMMVLNKYLKYSIKEDEEKKETQYYRRENRDPLATIKMVSTNGVPNKILVLSLNTRVEFIFEIESKDFIENVILNLIIKNQEGLIVTTISSYDNEFTKSLQEGVNSIHLTIENINFTPGDYYADVGLSPYSGGLSYDVLIDYPIFKVVNNSIVHWLDRPFGNFIVNDIVWK